MKRVKVIGEMWKLFLESAPLPLQRRAYNVSEPESVTSMMFLKLPGGWNEPVHPTPKKQALICLAGIVRVTASDAEAREIGPGDVWLMEDLIGKGHHTGVTSGEDFEALIVQYD